MKSDIEIAQEARMKPIAEIAASLGLADEDVIPYGRYKAKINHRLIHKAGKQGKLVLVTAISPTPAGEGKTTTSVGLADALNKIGKKTMVCLREPSLGPVFGVKGGAAAAATPRSSRWRTSTSTSPATSTPSAQRTTCSPPCSTTTSSRATP